MLTVLEKVDLLQKVPMFHDVRTESLARVAAIAQEASFEARKMLFSENDAAETMFVLLEGEVALMSGEQRNHTLVANQVVGALAMLAGEHYSVTAVAIKPTRALQIDQQEFYDAMAEDFNITRGVLRALVRLGTGEGLNSASAAARSSNQEKTGS